MYYSAYAFFGIHVPRDQWEQPSGTVRAESDRLDLILSAARAKDDRLKDVGHLSAGGYDQDMLFLCASGKDQGIEASLGTYRRFSFPDVETARIWIEGLQVLALEAGYSGLEAPAWIAVPDLS